MDIRRGVIRAFDADNYLADVQIVGSLATTLAGVPVAKHIGANLLTPGTRCGLLFFDEANPADACVFFVYDGAPGAWVTSGLIVDDAVGPTKIDPGEVWGISSKRLLNFVPYQSVSDLFRVDGAGDTGFASTISALPGTQTQVIYGAVTGNENSIVPTSSSQLGKLVLHNTTRGNSALISAVNTATNTVTLTAPRPANWAVGDGIQVNSLTCTGGYEVMYDLDFSGFLPSPARALVYALSCRDTSAASSLGRTHPYETWAASKSQAVVTQVVNIWNAGAGYVIPVNDRKICLGWNAGGASSFTISMQIEGWYEDASR